MDAQPSYGLWTLVALNSAVFIFFAFSFFRPRTARDWTSFGGFSAFVVALFVEMYGLFSDAAFDELAAKASTVVTTNSVTHPSNAIDIAPAISATVRDLVGAFAATVENRKEERA